MVDILQRALDFAAARETEAELLYKRWAQRAPTAQLASLLAEFGAAERGHHEMLLHVSPSDVVAQREERVAAAQVSKLLIEVPLQAALLSPKAVASAIRREEVLAALYEFLASLGGETAALFRALTAEEERHRSLLDGEVAAAARTLPSTEGVRQP